MTDSLRREIENAFNQKIIYEQCYSWGESYWLQLHPAFQKGQRTISIVNIYPNTEQKVHTHPGYEEIIFGLEGESIHWSDGHKIVLTKGKLGYIPAGGEHRMLNSSGQIAQMMSIVYPRLPFDLGSLSTIDDIELTEVAALVNLGAIIAKFAMSVRLAVTLIDNRGNLITPPKNFPDFCAICVRHKAGDCVLISPDCCNRHGKQLTVLCCKFGIHSIQSPIVINDRILGYLGCGYGRSTLPTDDEKTILKTSFSSNDLDPVLDAYEKVEIINRNHLQSVAETLSLVSASLVQLIVQTARDKQLSAYKLSLTEEKRRQAELENALNEAKLKLLESQVNPHFLFNTLNTIAQMSIMEGANTAAGLTYALSNMLRRSLSQNDNLVTVADEMTYINDYMLIQKTRFPDRFTVDIEIDSALMHTKIPFMTLMILVENTIQHGFRDIRWTGHLRITGRPINGTAVIEVVDNGIGIPEEVVSSMRLLTAGGGLSMHRGIGLRNVHRRLEHYFGDRASLTIGSNEGQGAKVVVKVPLQPATGDANHV